MCTGSGDWSVPGAPRSATTASASSGAATCAANWSATAVGTTPRDRRSNSSRPNCPSSDRIWVVTVGCDSPSSRPAAVNEPARCTARNVRRRERSSDPGEVAEVVEVPGVPDVVEVAEVLASPWVM